MNVSVRKARSADHAGVLGLLRALDLVYPSMDLSCFWVAEAGGLLAGVAELKRGETFALLSCVGVREDLQGRGIGRELVERITSRVSSPVFLYTVVPDFFRKAGFRDATHLPPGLPQRSVYGCSGCTPALCRCLVRPGNGS